MKHKSNSVAKTRDARQTRTVERIDAAFVALLQRRAYSAIRVSEIATKARVGRATFYAHYKSKHELLGSQLQRIALPLIKVASESTFLFDCTALFEHVRHVRFAWRALMTGASRLVAERILRDCVEKHMGTVLSCQGDSHSVQLAARFSAVSLSALIGWWVERDFDLEPVTMQAYYKALVGGGLTEFLALAKPHSLRTDGTPGANDRKIGNDGRNQMD